MKENNLMLIRSFSEIKGPYTLDQVVQNLKNKKLSINDDICISEKLWWPIYEIKEFKQIVEEARRSSLVGSGTTKTERLKTKSSTVTEAISQTFTDNLTEKLDTNINLEDEIVIEDIIEEDDLSTKRERSATKKLKSYGFEGSAEAKSQASKTSKKTTLIASLFVIATFTFVLYIKFLANPKENKEMFNQHLSKGIDLFKLGLFEESYLELEKSSNFEHNSDELNFYLATLLVQLKNRPYEGREYLNKLSTNNLFSIRSNNIFGNSYFVENNFKKAKNYYQTAKKINPLFAATEVNLASIQIKEGNYKKASKHIVTSLEMQIKDNYSELLLSYVYLQEAKDDSIVQKANVLLSHIIKNKKEYFSKAVILKAYYNLIKSNKNNDKFLKQILTVPINFDKQFAENVFINKEILSWNNLKSKCIKASASVKSKVLKTMLTAYCFIQAKDIENAKKSILQARKIEPSNSLVLALESYIMFKSGLKVDAEVLIGRSIKNNIKQKEFLPLYYQAILCETNQDFNCSKDNWTELYKLNGDKLWTLSGLSKAYFNLDRKISSQEYLKKAKMISNNYKPIIKVEYEINNL